MPFLLQNEYDVTNPITGVSNHVYEYLDVDTRAVVKTTEKKTDVVEEDPAEAEEPTPAGTTTFIEDGESAGSSIYGDAAIGSRTYKIKDPKKEINAGDGVKSLYNKWSLHSYKNTAKGTQRGKNDYQNYNKTVMDGNDDNILNPTARRIVQYASDNGGLGYNYSFSDFIQTEHYGQISNEYLITLRRFAYPIQDDIMNVQGLDSKGNPIDLGQPDLARCVTWMSPALGNDMKEILKFGTEFPWKEVESEIQKVAGNAKKRGKLGEMMDGS